MAVHEYGNVLSQDALTYEHSVLRVTAHLTFGLVTGSRLYRAQQLGMWYDPEYFDYTNTKYITWHTYGESLTAAAHVDNLKKIVALATRTNRVIVFPDPIVPYAISVPNFAKYLPYRHDGWLSDLCVKAVADDAHMTILLGRNDTGPCFAYSCPAALKSNVAASASDIVLRSQQPSLSIDDAGALLNEQDELLLVVSYDTIDMNTLHTNDTEFLQTVVHQCNPVAQGNFCH